MSRGWVALFIIAVVSASILFGLLDESGKRELKQQAAAAYTWVSCKINGGNPQNESTKDNQYQIVCNNQ
jgi:hypothetical protein